MTPLESILFRLATNHLVLILFALSHCYRFSILRLRIEPLIFVLATHRYSPLFSSILVYSVQSRSLPFNRSRSTIKIVPLKILSLRFASTQIETALFDSKQFGPYLLYSTQSLTNSTIKNWFHVCQPFVVKIGNLASMHFVSFHSAACLLRSTLLCSTQSLPIHEKDRNLQFLFPKY